MDDSTPSVQALGSATYAACQSILRFVREVVGPIVYDRTAGQPMFGPMAARAMFDRIHGWLVTFDRLDNPAHFQAVLSGSRAMFELAVDLTLIQLKEKGSYRRLLNWQQSAKLHWAERRLRHDPNDQDAADYIAKEEKPTKALRLQEGWKDERHRPRWTGNSLEADALEAEGLRHTGFMDYYNEQYTVACWLVHGSGVIGVLETPPHLLPYLSARGYRDAARFSIASLRLLLELLNEYTSEVDDKFSELEYQMAVAQDMTLKLHKQLEAQAPAIQDQK